MASLGPGLLALLIASSVTALELVTTYYPRTYFVLTTRKCPWFYVYSLIYGGVALLIVGTGLLHLEKLGLTDSWLQALVVGISIKSFLHIRLFSIPKSSVAIGGIQAGGKGEGEVVPIGLETVAYLFERFLLPQIRIDEFESRQEFLEPFLAKYTDVDDVYSRIKAAIPHDWPEAERDELELNIETLSKSIDSSSERARDAMNLYLKTMGRRSFQRIFPC